MGGYDDQMASDLGRVEASASTTFRLAFDREIPTEGGPAIIVPGRTRPPPRSEGVLTAGLLAGALGLAALLPSRRSANRGWSRPGRPCETAHDAVRSVSSHGRRREADPLPRDLNEIPRPVRWMLVAAIALGLVGAVVGLVLGLVAYPPTAWFAVLEVGLPSGLLGGLLGFIAGCVIRPVDQGRQAPGRS